MDCEQQEAHRRSDRRLVRMLARRYRRDTDLPLVLANQVRDYELCDRHCRWITAGLMHRLNRLLRRNRDRTAPGNGEARDRGRSDPGQGLAGLLVRACLRGEARIYREQSRDRPSSQASSPTAAEAAGRHQDRTEGIG